MIHIFRRIRKRLAEQNQFVRYSRYAIGEIVLVVIGILIALQINNANETRKESKALEGYLNSISLNIESDLKKANYILHKRKEIHKRSEYIDNSIQWRIRFDERYNVKDINYVSVAMKEAAELNYLNPNLSGFESLKNSGFLSKLQGSDLEQLLNNYYNLVSEIVLEETNYNQLILNSFARFNESNFEGAIFLFNPDYNHDWENYYEEYQPFFNEILQSPSFNSMIEVPFSLMVKYENIQKIGASLNYMINEQIVAYDGKVNALINDVFDVQGDIGYPQLIVDGAITSSYDFAGDTSDSSMWLIGEFLNDEIMFTYPELDWGAFFLYNGSGMIEQLRTRDFSIYTSMRLEMKGEFGGETVIVSIKDESNPKDGSEPNVILTLSDNWEYYEIPLSKFAPTDLTKVFLPVAFAFEGKPRIIHVRTVEYIK